MPSSAWLILAMYLTSFTSGFNESLASKKESIAELMTALSHNFSLSEFIFIDEADFSDSLSLLNENMKNFKRANEIDEDFVKLV